MELKRLRYDVKAEVRFTPEEAEYLVGRAKNHYDSTCRAAGMSCEDGARENGFIAQLKMFPRTAHIWDSRKIDLALKVPEPFAHYADKMRGKLERELNKVYSEIQVQYGQLNGDL